MAKKDNSRLNHGDMCVKFGRKFNMMDEVLFGAAISVPVGLGAGPLLGRKRNEPAAPDYN